MYDASGVSMMYPHSRPSRALHIGAGLASSTICRAERFGEARITKFEPRSRMCVCRLRKWKPGVQTRLPNCGDRIADCDIEKIMLYRVGT